MDIVQRALVQSARAENTGSAMMEIEREHQSKVRRDLAIAYHKSIGKVMLRGLGASLGVGCYIGAGFQQIAFHDVSRQEVLKLRMNSIGLSHTKAKDTAKSMQQEYDVAKHYMQENWLDTYIDVIKLPQAVGGFAVASMQPYVEGRITFESYKDIIGYSVDYSFITAQKEYVDHALNLYDNEGMFPDIFGRNNIFLNESETLLQVDTMPVTPRQLQKPSAFVSFDKQVDEFNHAFCAWQESLPSLANQYTEQN